MANKRVRARSQRLTLAKLTPPDWFGWLGVLAMLLLPIVRIKLTDGPWFFPLLSFGEWLLLPLGVCSMTMGFLSLTRIREKTLLPLCLSAIFPAAVWLAAMAIATAKSGVDSVAGDMFLSWAVHLIFPSMVFLPLLTMRVWRNRLMWALLIGLAVNAVLIFWQGYSAGIAPPERTALGFGGFLANQHDYGLMIGIALPLLAAWRGGHEKRNFLTIMLCTFLIPVLVMLSCYTASGLIAAAVGLTVAWAAWRHYAWILGVFLCLAVLGYGAGLREEHDKNQRALLTDSITLGQSSYRRASNMFQVRPFLGAGPQSFILGTGHEPSGSIIPTPWYASLLGGSGLLGLGMWIILLGELAARTMGRFGRRCLWHGGVLGGVAALAVAGFWTDGLPEGAGAMVGLLIALSILEEPESPVLQPPPRASRRSRGEAGPLVGASAVSVAKVERKKGDTEVISKS